MGFRDFFTMDWRSFFAGRNVNDDAVEELKDEWSKLPEDAYDANDD